MHPFSRYPVFLMGMCAGELCSRFDDQSHLPWPTSAIGFFPSCCCCAVRPHSELKPDFWGQRIISSTILLLGATGGVFVIDTIVRYQGGSSSGILGAVWLQALMPFLQLEIIVNLTRNQGIISAIGSAIRQPVFVFLGEISMCIYLIHWVVIYYLLWAIQGQKLQWPSDFSCPNDDHQSACQVNDV